MPQNTHGKCTPKQFQWINYASAFVGPYTVFADPYLYLQLQLICLLWIKLAAVETNQFVVDPLLHSVILRMIKVGQDGPEHS